MDQILLFYGKLLAILSGISLIIAIVLITPLSDIVGTETNGWAFVIDLDSTYSSENEFNYISNIYNTILSTFQFSP